MACKKVKKLPSKKSIAGRRKGKGLFSNLAYGYAGYKGLNYLKNKAVNTAKSVGNYLYKKSGIPQARFDAKIASLQALPRKKSTGIILKDPNKYETQTGQVSYPENKPYTKYSHETLLPVSSYKNLPANMINKVKDMIHTENAGMSGFTYTKDPSLLNKLLKQEGVKSPTLPSKSILYSKKINPTFKPNPEQQKFESLFGDVAKNKFFGRGRKKKRLA